MTIHFNIAVTTPNNTPLICYLAGTGIASATPLVSQGSTSIPFTIPSDILNNNPMDKPLLINVIIADINYNFYFEILTLWNAIGDSLDYGYSFSSFDNTPNTIQHGASLSETTTTFSVTGAFTQGNFK